MKIFLPVEPAEAPNHFAGIGAHAKCLLRAMDHPKQRDPRRTRRRAVESWLRCQGLIEVSINQ